MSVMANFLCFGCFALGLVVNGYFLGIIIHIIDLIAREHLRLVVELSCLCSTLVCCLLYTVMYAADFTLCYYIV